jgi:hypothetical protein
MAAMNHATFRGSSKKVLALSVVTAAVVVVVAGMMRVIDAVSDSRPPSRAVAVML